MNKEEKNKDIFVGGIALFGLSAGLLYYLLKKKPEEECIEGQTMCVGTDLYKCIGGKWVLYEANSELCGGEECVEGQTMCIGTDLYKCVNGVWILYKRNTYECGGTEVKHKECKTDAQGYIRCLDVPGVGVDQCDIDSDCPCTTNTQCPPYFYCIYNECLVRPVYEVVWKGKTTRFEQNLQRGCFLWVSGYITVERAAPGFPLVFPVYIYSYFKDRYGIEHTEQIWKGDAWIWWNRCKIPINMSTIDLKPIEKIIVVVPPTGRIVEIALTLY